MSATNTLPPRCPAARFTPQQEANASTAPETTTHDGQPTSEVPRLIRYGKSRPQRHKKRPAGPKPTLLGTAPPENRLLDRPGRHDSPRSRTVLLGPRFIQSATACICSVSTARPAKFSGASKSCTKSTRIGSGIFARPATSSLPLLLRSRQLLRQRPHAWRIPRAHPPSHSIAVVSASGNPSSARLGYGAAVLEGDLGFLQFFWSENRIGTQDPLAETIVVDERRPRAPRSPPPPDFAHFVVKMVRRPHRTRR